MHAEIQTVTLPSGFRVVVEYDSYPTNPREWDTLGTVVTL